ncbi:MAG: ABC transporter permease [Rhodothermales bacterium]|nr:ABC transporter permease [Rhodothermales bacterium]
MFDLETVIATWRHQFKYTPAFGAADLDEMERHLRDQVSDLVAGGTPLETAFRLAVAEMGGLPDATPEFEKMRWRKARHEGRLREELEVAWALGRRNIQLAYRNLWRDRVPAAINILGLSIALACCITVYVFLTTWYVLDSFHEHGERVLLAQHEVNRYDQRQTWGSVPLPLGPALEADLPQVEHAVRVNRQGVAIRRGEARFDEAITFVDPAFFDVVTFPLATGSPAALRDPSAVILSAPMAVRLFGDADPVGEVLDVTFNQREPRSLIVAGVLHPFPTTNGFRFDLLMGFDAQYELGLARRDDWSEMVGGLLLLARAATDLPAITAQMQRYVPAQNAAAPDWPIRSFGVDTFTDPSPGAYRIRGRMSEAADPTLTALLVAIAGFMLLLSVFNYINISLGTASRRLKEIALRKVIGGNRRQLVVQFMTENVLLCLIALLIGLVLARLVMVPVFNATFVLNLELAFWEHLGFWAFAVGLLLAVGIASGGYPALYVASFEPTAIFRGRTRLADNAWFTRAFLTFQFVLAFISVILSVVVSMNSRYLIRQDWGYDPTQTLVFELEDTSQYPAFRDQLAQHNGVVSAGGAETHIGRTSQLIDLALPDETTLRVLRYDVDPTYLQTLGLPLVEGRLFDSARAGEAGQSVVVNERFVRAMGWEAPLGRLVRLDTTQLTVVGVVRDFSFFLLVEPQPALLVASDAAAFPYLTLRLKRDQIAEVEAYALSTWKRLYPDTPLTHFRQTAVFDDTYQQYNGVARTVNYLAGLALLIASMGLFGLASQNISRRMKEISIRKVVGASLTRITVLVNRRLITQLALAGAIATALCVIGLTLLLDNIRDTVPIAHMPLTPLPFLLSYGIVMASTALAVGSQTYKIAATNPAEVLRGE